ncbi:hypothetical protein [Mechercharimyces sp. CAU 1602]|uniref:hypothetical protein n=1 Tax=Mechercharimyces sp. CAU 1602 TaxID=2973933 RepID=UPI002162E68E|nr:hypothetical protein [Mechercharimyces sp. CAU 1602]MCS1350078.1 hypothetical protein [Mechercharimyces sp. CAU 1602]
MSRSDQQLPIEETAIQKEPDPRSADGLIFPGGFLDDDLQDIDEVIFESIALLDGPHA